MFRSDLAVILYLKSTREMWHQAKTLDRLIVSSINFLLCSIHINSTNLFVQILIFSYSGWSKWMGFNADIHQILVQQHKAHLHSSAYQWCTIFLISVLYKIPVFCVVQNSFFSVMYNIPDFSDVQYSCFLWCTIFLISVMYNIPLFCDVQYSCFPCSIIVWCMIIWCSLFLKMAWCT